MEQSVVDTALYQDGKRTETRPRWRRPPRASANKPSRGSRDHGLDRPVSASNAQLYQEADEFGIHEVALEDAIVAHQRPKLERYDDILFVVLQGGHLPR